MSASTSGGGSLSPQANAALQEGIGLVFGRWTALQMAVENEWGGPVPRQGRPARRVHPLLVHQLQGKMAPSICWRCSIRIVL
uniref:Uncharacterized protein n=1 Tax=Aegilops tauschii subsp. strangulata TaxID=200361 RepID=A0A452Y0R6_AEGTS